MPKNIKLIFIAITAVILLALFSALSGLFIAIKRMNHGSPAVVTPKEPPKKYSRITFFHATPPFCSLSIPESWEGSYRVRDTGKRVTFYYFDESGEYELFKIDYWTEEGYIENSRIGDKELLRKSGRAYSYALSTTDAKDVQKYVDMKGELVDILKSFSCQ